MDLSRKVIQQGVTHGRRIASAQRRGGRVIVWPLIGTAFPCGSQWAFGYTLEEPAEDGTPQVKIHRCRYQHGANVPVTGADTIVRCAHATTYVWYRYIMNTTPHSLVISSGATEPPYGDPNVVEKLLYEFQVLATEDGLQAVMSACLLTEGFNAARR